MKILYILFIGVCCAAIIATAKYLFSDIANRHGDYLFIQTIQVENQVKDDFDYKGYLESPSNYYQFMRITEKGDFDLAKAKIKEGDQEFVKGHEAHAGLIQKEANGEKVVPNILLMHAEDQLMSAETIKMMALEIIKLNQRLYSLEK